MYDYPVNEQLRRSSKRNTEYPRKLSKNLSMVLFQKIILFGWSKLIIVPNNSYAFLEYFDKCCFLSGIWRRKARPRATRSRGTCMRVYAHARVWELPKRSMPLSLVHLPRTFRSRCLRCEIASDIGTLISVTGDNEPSKGCRVKSLASPAVSNTGPWKQKRHAMD